MAVSDKAREIIILRNPNQKETKWTSLLLFTGLGSTIGTAVPVGYAIGVTNSLHMFIKNWSEETLMYNYKWHLSKVAIEILWALIVSILLIGGIIGSITGASIANRFGRKGGIFICFLWLAIGGVCCLCCRLASSVELILIGRFTIGLAGGLTTAVLPMYLSEIAPLKLRGTLSVFCGMGFSAGVVIGQVFSLKYVFGTEDRWHYALSFHLIFVLICLIPFCVYPESPKWLIALKKDLKEGSEQLKRLRGNEVCKNEIENELNSIQNESNNQGKTIGFKEVLSDPKLKLPMIVVCVFQGGQQLSGINAIFFYSVTIFLRAGLSDASAQWTNLGAGCINLAVSSIGPILMEKINRRPLMLFSTFCCFLSLLLFAIMLYFIESFTIFANICIACIFSYIVFFQLGLGPIPLFIGAELFTVDPRPVAMSIGSFISWTCNFVVGMTFPSLQNIWGPFVFLPFAIACLIIFLITLFYLPETKGRDPNQVAALMEQGFKSKVLK